ncbi:hypothetical protein [Nocardia shimofusensis]|uniref:hypothetical protein n=1 Tax=Nocardia shimofusensis TaxID=228596 RepID=UPI000A4B3D09|nr:hypothetical protein [Nocardia shimofusensis]
MTQLTDSDNRADPGGPVDIPDTPPGRSLDTTADRAAVAPPDGPAASPGPDGAVDRIGALPTLDELRLAAEEAEAEAAAAEAVAAAARARARATRLRRRATTAANSVAAEEEPEAKDPGVDHGTDSPTAAAEGSSTSADRTGEQSGDDDSADERSATEVTVASPGRSWRAPNARALIGAIAIALIAVSGTVSGLMVHHHQQTVQANQRKVEFTEAARAGVVALTSLDFSRAEQDVRRVLEHSTGAFRDDFESRSQDFTSVIQQSQVATAGTVNSAAVESMTEDSAVVLVAATSQVTNSAGAQEEPRAWRLSVTVTREGDTIKMSKVEFVP